MDTYGEPSGEARELVMRVAETLNISPRQLERYRQYGLLQHPNGPGLGRGKGRELHYPSGTVNRLYAICDARKHDRRFDHIAWRLWLDGDDRLTDLVHKSLKHLATRYARMFPPLVQNGDLTAAGERRLETLETSRIPRFFRPVRRRLGRKRITMFISEALKILSGEFAGWNDPDFNRDLVIQGLGVPRRGPGSDRFRWVRKSENQKELSRLLHPGAFCEVLKGITSGDLVRARNDFITRLLPAIDRLGLDVVKFDAMQVQVAAFLVWLVFVSAQDKEYSSDNDRVPGAADLAPTL